MRITTNGGAIGTGLPTRQNSTLEGLRETARSSIGAAGFRLLDQLPTPAPNERTGAQLATAFSQVDPSTEATITGLESSQAGPLPVTFEVSGLQPADETPVAELRPVERTVIASQVPEGTPTQPYATVIAPSPVQVLGDQTPARVQRTLEPAAVDITAGRAAPDIAIQSTYETPTLTTGTFTAAKPTPFPWWILLGLYF